jgi:hypothetical protein
MLQAGLCGVFCGVVLLLWPCPNDEKGKAFADHASQTELPVGSHADLVLFPTTSTK